MPARLVSLALLATLFQLPIAPSSAPPATAAPPRRPNVLIVVTDDQRASGTMAVLPRTRRWFAGGGVRYREAYATTPVCCPARATLMTGQYAHNHGVTQNDRGDELDESSTIQRYLDDAGYRTGLFGKFLNAWPSSRNPEHFDRWGIFEFGYERVRWNVNGRVRRVRGYTTDITRRMAVRFVRRAERRDGKPWFLLVAPFAPHLPATPAARHAGAPVPRPRRGTVVRERDLSDKPPHVGRGHPGPAPVPKLRVAQLRSLMAVDDLVARLTGTMRRLGEARNTLAFFLSDNGFAWGDRGWVGKSLPYTESIGIPLFARWPAGPLGRGDSDRLVGNVDIAPTIVDAARVEDRLVEPMDGRSLLGSWNRPWILTEFWPGDRLDVPAWASIRARDRQYVEYYDDTRLRPMFREYYDLERDPEQRRNRLAGPVWSTRASPAETTRMSVQLAVARSCRGTAPPRGCP